MFNVLIEREPQALEELDELIIGEALSLRHVERAIQTLALHRFVNGYGPTEATTFSCTFDILARQHEAVRGVSLQIAKGECVAIMGPSGSGKSTLLYMLGALAQPSSGEIVVCGVSTKQAGKAELAHLRRDAIGFIFQSFNLVPVLTVRENISLPAVIARRTGPDADQRAAELVEALQLTGVEDKFPSELSGGEQQRVAVARALLGSPQVILADEPTGNLDSETGDALLALLRRIQAESNCTLVIVTHDHRVAAAADRVIRIQDGEIQGELVLGPVSAEDLTAAIRERTAALLDWGEAKLREADEPGNKRARPRRDNVGTA